jgi:hypothetical protein
MMRRRMWDSLDGTKTLHRLISLDKEVKVIAAGPEATDPVLSRFGEHGFISCLTKPYDLNELKDVLNAVLNDLPKFG